MPLTNIEIKNAQPKDKEYVMSDGGGLVILVKPSGAKLWRYRYSINAKKQKLSLGSYPEISLAQARICLAVIYWQCSPSTAITKPQRMHVAKGMEQFSEELEAVQRRLM